MSSGLPSSLSSGTPSVPLQSSSSAAEAMPLFSNEIAFRKYLRLMARYERLMEISQQLNSTLDLGTLLNRIIKAATELTDTETASIMLIDQPTGELHFEASSEMTRGAMDAIVVPMEGSLAGWVAQNAQPVLVEDVHNDPRFFSGVDETIEFKTKNLACVPMIAHGKVIGVVEAINKQDSAAWTDDDMNTLSALAAQAAIAIENARLFQQSDFISEMVHELRTPLAALKASTTLLLRPELAEHRRKDIILTMQGETDRLSRLTTDFLDLARLESGRTRLEINVFKIGHLIDESLDVVHPQAAEHGITLHPIYDASLELESDRGKIKQVLLNLLTNAIKYNHDQGEIHISVILDDDRREDMARIEVRDTGKGISPENQTHMFEKFYRAADISGYTQGTGLGLVIAKRIVEGHGGEMGFTSSLGVGTTFYFTLPRHIQDNTEPSESAEAKPPTDIANTAPTNG